MRRNAVEGATVALRQNRLYPFRWRRRGQERQRTVHASKVRSLDIPANVESVMFLSVGVSPSVAVITTLAPDCFDALCNVARFAYSLVGNDTVSALVRLVVVSAP